MSRRKRLVATGLGLGVGAAAAAVTAGILVERRLAQARKKAQRGAERLERLHGDAVPVRAEDGITLYVEVDQVRPHAAEEPDAGPTIVFVHGYGLNLDCWRAQREYFRGKYRLVFYDQRSHGRSERSSNEHATIDQLGRDLLTVLDQVVPDGPVVLVGHSMGGMTIIALAGERPDLFGTRVVGVGLLSTTAGGVRTHQVLSPRIPERLGLTVGPRLLASLARTPELVDGVRRRGSNLGYLLTDLFAFGDEVPAGYVEFVDEMLAATSIEVFAQFFPELDHLDKWAAIDVLGKVPTTVVSGTKDRLIAVGHSRKMASRITGARLVECPGAGHMVILERAERVNRVLAELFDEAS